MKITVERVSDRAFLITHHRRWRGDRQRIAVWDGDRNSPYFFWGTAARTCSSMRVEGEISFALRAIVLDPSRVVPDWEPVAALPNAKVVSP